MLLQRNVRSVCTSILVDTIPYQLETRSCYGLPTSKLQDLHWNEIQPADIASPELRKKWQLSWRFWQCVDNNGFHLTDFIFETWWNKIVFYALFKNKSTFPFYYLIICVLINPQNNVSDHFDNHRRNHDFWLGGAKPQFTCNDVIRNFQKRNFLWGKNIVEWKIWCCSLLALNQYLGKERAKTNR